MLPRKNLITLKQEFSRIRKTGRTFDSDSFGLLVSYTQSPSSERVAFIVSKKVSLKSVERHDVKRKLTDAVKPYLDRISQNTQLVFLAKAKAVPKSKNELSVELEALLKRIKLL